MKNSKFIIIAIMSLLSLVSTAQAGNSGLRLVVSSISTKEIKECQVRVVNKETSEVTFHKLDEYGVLFLDEIAAGLYDVEVTNGSNSFRYASNILVIPGAIMIVDLNMHTNLAKQKSEVLY